MTGALLTLLLLLAEHVLLWRIKLWLPIRYAIGVGALNAGATLAAGLAGEGSKSPPGAAYKREILRATVLTALEQALGEAVPKDSKTIVTEPEGQR